jgi:hypothetical protein
MDMIKVKVILPGVYQRDAQRRLKLVDVGAMIEVSEQAFDHLISGDGGSDGQPYVEVVKVAAAPKASKKKEK